MMYLHSLVFRVTADVNDWIRLIRGAYGNLSPDWIQKETQPPRYEITIEGTWQNLRKFMKDFPDNLCDINDTDDDDDDEALPNLQNLHM